MTSCLVIGISVLFVCLHAGVLAPKRKRIWWRRGNSRNSGYGIAIVPITNRVLGMRMQYNGPLRAALSWFDLRVLLSYIVVTVQNIGCASQSDDHIAEERSSWGWCNDLLVICVPYTFLSRVLYFFGAAFACWFWHAAHTFVGFGM